MDFQSQSAPPVVPVMQSDSQSRFIGITLYDGGVAYKAPSGAVYTVEYHGPGANNTGWYDTIQLSSGTRKAVTVDSSNPNIVTLELAEQALRVNGEVEVSLCVVNNTGYKLNTFPIICRVTGAPYVDPTSVRSYFYVTGLTSAQWLAYVTACQDAQKRAEDAAATFKTDTTLSIEGKAADAAKVGEGIGKLKEDLDNKEYRIANCDTLVSTKNLCDYTKVQHGKYISKYNTETKEIEYIELSGRATSPLIPVRIGHKYAFSGNFGTEIQGLLFDKNLNFLNNIYRVTDGSGLKVTGLHGNYIFEITKNASPKIMYFIYSGDDSEQKMMLLEDVSEFPAQTLIQYNPTFKSCYIKDAVKNIVNEETQTTKIDTNSGVISCYGDSLTAGAGVGSVYSDTYCGQLATLLGVTVNRCGVGGEGVETIAMRQGGQSVFVKPFTIPSDDTAVEIELVNSVGKSVIIGWQGWYKEWGINPVTIDGIEGNINYNASTQKNTFSRSLTGDGLNITRPAKVISNSYKNSRNDITVIWAGTNGTKALSDVTYLTTIIDTMINSLNTKCYIIVGLMAVADGYIPSKNVMESVNAELQNHYGYHYLDVYQYLLTYALEDCNILATEQDKADVSDGKVPSSLRHDAVHLNKNGYSIIANLLAKKIKTLGWL